jgi:hypothetical protein
MEVTTSLVETINRTAVTKMTTTGAMTTTLWLIPRLVKRAAKVEKDQRATVEAKEEKAMLTVAKEEKAILAVAKEVKDRTREEKPQRIFGPRMERGCLKGLEKFLLSLLLLKN